MAVGSFCTIIKKTCCFRQIPNLPVVPADM